MGNGAPAMAALAQQLLALEAVRAQPSSDQITEAVRVCEKLRPPLTRLVGPAGFGSLMSRALSLAKAQCPALGPMRADAEGSLMGFDHVRANPGPASPGATLVMELLTLLAVFIGEPLTHQLVSDAWKFEDPLTSYRRSEEKP